MSFRSSNDPDELLMSSTIAHQDLLFQHLQRAPRRPSSPLPRRSSPPPQCSGTIVLVEDLLTSKKKNVQVQKIVSVTTVATHSCCRDTHRKIMNSYRLFILDLATSSSSPLSPNAPQYQTKRKTLKRRRPISSTAAHQPDHLHLLL
ncbi:unnamed protein product [Amoebophrya sp. A25]|nr:unnamed protein product [Amoebophrya sp. A25]|eukprot:GSA25T00014956001.1